MSTLQVSNLTCVRGGRTLFERLSFDLAQGGLLHLRGANGTGKTSLLRIVCGLVQPEHGQIYWKGQPIGSLDADFRKDLLYLGHHNAMHEALTVRENLAFSLGLGGSKPDDAAIGAALKQLALRPQQDRLVRHLSQGQKRRAALCRLLLQRARLWALDEPFVALDQAGVDWLDATLAAHLASGGLAVVTSHQPVLVKGVQVQFLDLSA